MEKGRRARLEHEMHAHPKPWIDVTLVITSNESQVCTPKVPFVRLETMDIVRVYHFIVKARYGTHYQETRMYQ
jgi:hypothetical protein